MLLKETVCGTSDSSGALEIRLFQLYGGFYRKYTIIGLYTKGSIRNFKINKCNLWKKKKRKNYYKGRVIKNYATSTVKNIKLHDTSNIKFYHNLLIILRKKKLPAALYFKGTISSKVGYLKYLSLFRKSLILFIIKVNLLLRYSMLNLLIYYCTIYKIYYYLMYNLTYTK